MCKHSACLKVDAVVETQAPNGLASVQKCGKASGQLASEWEGAKADPETDLGLKDVQGIDQIRAFVGVWPGRNSHTSAIIICLLYIHYIYLHSLGMLLAGFLIQARRNGGSVVNPKKASEVQA